MAPSPRPRQPRLFTVAGPWIERFGAGFFRDLPVAPGVYFFRDVDDRLLYIGQSGCLRKRIASYRQADPDRNPKRTLRLIRQTFRIEWELCADAADAVARESALLLQHRPPFNRAGVWMPPEMGIRLQVDSGWLELELIPALDLTQPPAGEVFGPLPGRIRRAFGPLARCLFRAMHPAADWWDYPAGLLSSNIRLCVGWRLPPGHDAPLAQLRTFLQKGSLEASWSLPEPTAGDIVLGFPEAFWQEQAEAISSFQKAFLIMQQSEFTPEYTDTTQA